MIPCPACGHVNDDAARFCSRCGAAVASDPRLVEERKVVTVLFADLVGFTSRAERLDPEDVRALLAPYYARLRTELERFGGIVEKFIGDAVMALFGGPVTHEDDPERAVRAALAIRDWVVEQPDELQLRIAVNTGEALIVLGARPGHGEGMASGDVVNTASRLQSAAPVNGILVGEATYRATSDVIDYADAEAVLAKGKQRPIPVWQALQARSRPGGDRPGGERTALVGREHELATLVEALARTRRDRSSQLITLTGVPGMGKTRLIAELREVVDADPALIRWRQGRSLPYGDGVSLWALTEMVKAEAGILDGDQAAEVEAKLAASVDAAVEPADAGWVLTHLRPLVGLGGSEDLSADRRSEAFAAWRRFFEGLAEEAPLVLAFDDLQWADDVLLDFIDHLTEWAAGSTVLVVCASRPELFERRRDWGGGKRNAATISLAPLSPADTAQLIGGLRAGSHIPAALRDTLVAKAGGNPLYAEQYLRMLAERGSADELPLPETVQGIVAARLDRLPAEEKQLLQSAAVVGTVFWPGALLVPESLARSRLDQLLHTLERKDFIRRARRSSVAGQSEYSFLQDLVRDVAYGQIPRAPRGAMHRHVADWFAAVSESADRAEALAHHYLSAVQLAQAAGRLDDDLLAQAVTSLHQAGDHALALGAHSRAVSYYASGTDLAAPATREHGRLLFRLGRARFIAGDEDPRVLASASTELLGCADQETAAEAEATLAELEWVRGNHASAVAHLEKARALVEDRPLSRAKAAVMSTVARHLMTADDNAEAIRVGAEVLAMAEELGMDAVRSSALNSIGVAKSHSGDPTGEADLERSAAIASAANLPNELCHARGNMARLLWEQGRLDEAARMYEDAGATAHRFGLDAYVRWVRGDRAADRFVLGEWEEALTAAEAFIADVEAGSPHYSATSSYAARASVRLGRGDDGGARSDAESSLEVARQSGDRQNLFPWLATAADIFYELGDVDRAAGLAGEFLAGVPGSGRSALDYHHMLAWTLCRVGRGQELLDALPDVDSPWTRAAVAFASGDLAQAAAICQAMGAASQEARVRLWLAAELVAGHHDAEARDELERVLGFYRRVRGTRYIAAAEALLSGHRASVS